MYIYFCSVRHSSGQHNHWPPIPDKIQYGILHSIEHSQNLRVWTLLPGQKQSSDIGCGSTNKFCMEVSGIISGRPTISPRAPPNNKQRAKIPSITTKQTVRRVINSGKRWAGVINHSCTEIGHTHQCPHTPIRSPSRTHSHRVRTIILE